MPRGQNGGSHKVGIGSHSANLGTPNNKANDRRYQGGACASACANAMGTAVNSVSLTAADEVFNPSAQRGSDGAYSMCADKPVAQKARSYIYIADTCLDKIKAREESSSVRGR